ncbi:MAG: 2Fe-2S iron-sulfur cluster-binding protein [Planctomycetota bacterium]
MPQVIIDGRPITIPDRKRLNGIEAARLAGVEIPHYCWHPGLSVVGSCRMCLVETGARDAKTGKITMQQKLSPACALPMTEGLVIVTNSEKVARARAMVEEDLLLRHPIDCPICDKAGECLLQDYHFKHGQSERRADLQPFTSRRRDIGDVTLFVDRCVMCSRCVRFAREISGTNELMVVNRGAHEEIDVVPGRPLHNNLSGNVVDLCPVGALGDKDFLYKQRVWFMRRHRGVCTGCATGCSIYVEENQDRVYRIKPRENPHVNKWWICNEGRYGYPHVHDPRRLDRPRRREADQETEVGWIGLPEELSARLGRAGHVAAALSPYLTVEEAFLLCQWIRGLDSHALLALGPVPTRGDDEVYPAGFRVSAEKCPNRKGVEAVLAHFAGEVVPFEELLGEVGQGKIQGAWVAGGYKSEWIDEATAARFEALDVLVVQDLFPSPLSRRATYELPASAFPERDGSYVNREDRLQSVEWAIRPPSGVRTEGGLYWEMLARGGLFRAREVLADVTREILYFSAASGGVPEVGIDLRVNLLADVPDGSYGA